MVQPEKKRKVIPQTKHTVDPGIIESSSTTKSFNILIKSSQGMESYSGANKLPPSRSPQSTTGLFEELSTHSL